MFFQVKSNPRNNLIYGQHRWGDLVVPTGWRRWGRSMNFPSFCRISLKGLKGDSASSCSRDLESTYWSYDISQYRG